MPKTNTKKLLAADKYTINNHVNSTTHPLILKHLDISQPTFWRKVNVKVGDSSGFEICQLKQIADILQRNILELLSDEAKIYYGFTPHDDLSQ